jgi:predicted DNA-binding transcriptional regulator YafY
MAVRGARIARLLKLIALLKGPTGWNGRRLAEHFGTSRRNVQRDMSVLRMAGVPVFTDADYAEGGAYRIRSDFFFPKVALTDQECLDISVLARLAERDQTPLLREAAVARDKLVQTLPLRQQDLIRDASELFDVLSLGMADHDHCCRVMLDLQKCLLTKVQVEGIYNSPHEKMATRVSLQPRCVFLARQAWYVAAHDNKAGETKLYRLARFKELKLTARPVTVGQDWSLREHLGHAWGVMRGDRDHHVEVRFDGELGPVMAETLWHATQEVERQPDGSYLFRATVSGLGEIIYWVLGWGPHAQVVRPVELVEDVKVALDRALCLYSR